MSEAAAAAAAVPQAWRHNSDFLTHQVVCEYERRRACTLHRSNTRRPGSNTLHCSQRALPSNTQPAVVFADLAS